MNNKELIAELDRIYGRDSKVIHIQMRYENEVKKYLAKIEKAHWKAAKSKLRFGTGTESQMKVEN